MLKHYLKQSLLFLLISFVVLGLFSSIPVKAVGTEVTGLSLTLTNSNQGLYALVGSYNCFASDKKLVVYDSNGTLTKTYNFVFYSTPIAGQSKIYTVNSTCLAVVSTDYVGSAGNYYVGATVGILNVDTLTYTSFFDNYISASSTTILTLNSIIFSVSNGIIYGIVQSYVATFNCGWILFEIYPTYSIILNHSTTKEDYFQGIPITVSADTPNYEYIFAGGVSGTSRYTIYKINLGTGAISIIGTSSLDYTYSNTYIYSVGYKWHYIDASYYCDVYYVFSDDSVTGECVAQISRFNDTNIVSDLSYYIDTSFVSSPVNIRRPLLAYQETQQLNTTDLQYEFDTDIVIVGTSYGLYQKIIFLTGLDTMSPTWNGMLFSISGFQSKTHYYSSSNDIGGIITLTGVGIYIDYQNGKMIADTFSSIYAPFTYYYLITPLVTQTGNNFPLSFLTTYTYTANLYFNGILAGYGNYTVFSSGLCLTQNDANGAYPQQRTDLTSFNSGAFVFFISPRTSLQSTMYEKFIINMTISTPLGTTFYYTVSHMVTFGNTPIPSNTPTGDFGGSVVTSSPISPNVFILLLFFMIIVFPFALYFGNVGLFFGLIVWVILMTMTGFLPIWGMFLMGMGIFFLIYQELSGRFSLPQLPQVPHVRKGKEET